MADPKIFTGRKESFVVVKSESGEEYICLESALKKRSEATKEELKNCVSDSSSGGGSAIGG